MWKIFLLILLVFNMFGCSLLKECSEEHLSNSTSPDGKYVAALFMRNCGATTPYVFHVNLKENSEEFSFNLNGAMYEGEVFDINRHKVNIIWKDSKTLLIECKDCPANEPVRIEKTWKDVSISYQSKSG